MIDCVHEAGHAHIRAATGYSVIRIRVSPRHLRGRDYSPGNAECDFEVREWCCGSCDGFMTREDCRFDAECPSCYQKVVDYIAGCYAGPVANDRLSGSCDPREREADHATIASLRGKIKGAAKDDIWTAIVQSGFRKANQLVDNHSTTILQLAEQVFAANGHLEGDPFLLEGTEH